MCDTSMREHFISIATCKGAQVLITFRFLHAYKNAKINTVCANINVDYRSCRQMRLIFLCFLNVPTAAYELFMFRSVKKFLIWHCKYEERRKIYDLINGLKILLKEHNLGGPSVQIWWTVNRFKLASTHYWSFSTLIEYLTSQEPSLFPQCRPLLKLKVFPHEVRLPLILGLLKRTFTIWTLVTWIGNGPYKPIVTFHKPQ
jgi:hypothetical protein